MSATDSSADDYFHSVEETFIRLRGAPLLLSPADWQTAKDWHERGIPVALVGRVLEEVFARLHDRDPERKIQSLRYCAPAVEEAWREIRDLGATEGRLEPLPVDVEARLGWLSERLPSTLPGREVLQSQLLSLSGDAEAVEAQLQRIEQDFLTRSVGELAADARRLLDERVARALSRARSRVDAEALTELEQRLRREFTRQDMELPVLSLFTAAEDPSS